MNIRATTKLILSPATALANTMYTDAVDLQNVEICIVSGSVIGDGAKYTLTVEGLDHENVPLSEVEFSYIVNENKQLVAPPEGVEVNGGETISIYVNGRDFARIEAEAVRIKLVKKTAGTHLCFHSFNYRTRY